MTLAIKPTRTGWMVGQVHARMRNGKPAVEIRRPQYFSFGTGAVTQAGMLGAVLSEPQRMLRYLSGHSKWTQAQWAKRAGVDVRTIRRILNEGQEPSVRTLRKLLEAL